MDDAYWEKVLASHLFPNTEVWYDWCEDCEGEMDGCLSCMDEPQVHICSY